MKKNNTKLQKKLVALLATAVVASSFNSMHADEVAQGAFGGAATGALIGGVAGGGRGAGIGAASGLGIGLIGGGIAKSERKKREREDAEYRQYKQQQAERELENLSKENRRLKKQQRKQRKAATKQVSTNRFEDRQENRRPKQQLRELYDDTEPTAYLESEEDIEETEDVYPLPEEPTEMVYTQDIY